jgi:hypothetical protein
MEVEDVARVWRWRAARARRACIRKGWERARPGAVTCQIVIICSVVEVMVREVDNVQWCIRLRSVMFRGGTGKVVIGGRSGWEGK